MWVSSKQTDFSQQAYINMYNKTECILLQLSALQISSNKWFLVPVYSTVYSGVDQRKHQSYTSLAAVPEIHRRPVNFPHEGPITRNMFPFDDVIMS